MANHGLRKVTKSNDLIEASYHLSLNEQRLVLAALSRIDPRKKMSTGIKITAAEFAEIFEINPKYAYEALREGASRLYERSITRIRGAETEDTRWIDQKALSADGDAYAIIHFSSRIEPYLSQLSKRLYTTYAMKRITKLKSAYSMRLFEMMMQFNSTGFLVIKITDLRERLNLGKRYSRWHDMKKRIIDPTVVDLQRGSGLEIRYDAIKKGRAVHRLEFYFKPVAHKPVAIL